VARYGDEKAQKPRYDLEAARSLIARSTPAAASWGPARTADQRPVEPAAHPLTGAAVDVTRFTVQRRIAPAGRGMSTLDLDADALARSRALADVRLVDSSGRQVPYVIERQDEPLALSLSLGPRRELPDNESAYTVRMPYTTLPSGTRLVITTPAGVFEREVRLLEPGEGSRDARLIGSRSWRHAEPDHAPPALSFDLPERISRQIELRISEGDNAPLTIRSAKLFMPAHALRFHHPGSALTLLYGNSEVGPPRYDLALLAPRIYREPAQRVYFATAINPGSEKESGVERHFFWIVIGGVALVLMLLLARLLSGLSPR
jgi:hypothetical protein